MDNFLIFNSLISYGNLEEYSTPWSINAQTFISIHMFMPEAICTTDTSKLTTIFFTTPSTGIFFKFTLQQLHLKLIMQSGNTSD